MNQTDAYHALRAQGKDKGQAARAIAITAHGVQARHFMSGWRASLRSDDLEGQEARYAATHGRRAGDAFTDGWVLAASVA